LNFQPHISTENTKHREFSEKEQTKKQEKEWESEMMPVLWRIYEVCVCVFRPAAPVCIGNAVRPWADGSMGRWGESEWEERGG